MSSYGGLFSVPTTTTTTKAARRLPLQQRRNSKGLFINPSSCSHPRITMAIPLGLLSVLFLISEPFICHGLELNQTLITRKHQQHQHPHRHGAYSIDELLATKFPTRISNDIDMDPCKSSKWKHPLF